MNKNISALLIISAFVLGVLLMWQPGLMMNNDSNMGAVTMESMDEHRSAFLSHRDEMTSEMREHGEYRCCLATSCSYCIEKTPGHGEGATCDCLADIVAGEHPCGECIGEILEGHGSPYLAEYFAVAIAEEVGEQHLDTLKQIIFEKYGFSEENQI